MRGRGGRRSGGGSRKRKKGRGDSEFVNITGLWRPDERGKKHLGQGFCKTEQLQELVEQIEDKGGNGAYFYLFKNGYAESESDPKYNLTALPMGPYDGDDDEDEDDRPRRRKKKAPPKRSKKRRDEEEDEDDEDEDEGYDDDEDDEDPPF
jgi:hypothetical protein